MLVECEQCLWQGTLQEWQEYGSVCPNCPCVVYKVIEEYGS